MQVIVWVPVNPINLVKLIFRLSKKPLIYHNDIWDGAELAAKSEWLAYHFRDKSTRTFRPHYRPTFVSQRVIKHSSDTMHEVVQPQNRKSLYYFLVEWEYSGREMFVVSGDCGVQEAARRLAPLLHQPFPPYFQMESAEYPMQIIRALSDCAHFMIFPNILFDVHAGVMIVAKDDALMSDVCNHLGLLGEPAIVRNNSPQFQREQTKMVNHEPGGYYVDELPDALKWWR